MSRLPRTRSKALDGALMLPMMIPADAFPENWGIDPERFNELAKLSTGRNFRHGLCAEIPIQCFGERCVYRASCELLKRGTHRVGEKCLKEIRVIVSLLDRYAQELGVDLSDESAIIDATLIKELVNCEVILDRCDRHLAANPLVEEVAFGFTSDGEPIMGPSESKASIIRDKTLKQKHEMLSILNATRRDRIKNPTGVRRSPAEEWADMIAKEDTDIIDAIKVTTTYESDESTL